MFDEEKYTYETILDRMLDTIPDNIDKREGSVMYDILSPTAIEMTQMYMWLLNAIDLIFVDTAVGEYLDRICNQVGITRRTGTKAIKQAMFYDENNQLIDIDIESRFSCENSYWIAIEKISTGIYKMQSESEGSANNSIVGNLLPIDYIENLGIATLDELLIPGEDEEDDEKLRERYYEQINEKAFAGNITDYKKKTKEIDGVGAVKVTPVWNGGGTVKLTILDSDFNKSSNSLIQKVQQIIDPDSSANGMGLAPIGHSVTVDTVKEKKITVKANITTNGQIEKNILKNNVVKEIEKYLLDLRKIWEDDNSIIIRIAKIEALILNTENVVDVSNVTINNETSNIALEIYEIPMLGEVVIE